MDEIEEEWWWVDGADSMSTSMGVSTSGYKSKADNGEADGRDEIELLGERSDVDEVLIASWA